MALIDKGCMLTQVEAIEEMGDHANKGEMRLQLTSMLRCAGLLTCDKAVDCSDQAFGLLRRYVLPEGDHSVD